MFVQSFDDVLTQQSEIRSLCINHWGSEQGIAVLSQLSQLYMFLIWETIVLETISQSDASADEMKLVEKDLDMLKASVSASQDDAAGNYVLDHSNIVSCKCQVKHAGERWITQSDPHVNSL